MTNKRKWTKSEIKKVLALRAQGLGYKEIAEIVRPSQKTAWRKIGDICREHEAEKKVEAAEESDIDTAPSKVKSSLVTMTADDRVSHLLSKLKTSARGRAILGALDEDLQTLFTEMYAEVIQEFESMTSAEDQMLMQALLAYCHYTRAAQMSLQCEDAFRANIAKELDEDDPRRQLVGMSDRYKAEMEKKHKEYVTLMDKLKATRDQRLKSVTDQRESFGELQREFVAQKKRRSVLAEIMEIQRFTDEELERLLAGGVGPDGEHRPWLIGNFDDYTQ